MMMRYWRHYPRFLQSVLLLLLIFTLGSFSLVVANFVAMKVFGLKTIVLTGLSLQSPPALIHAAKLMQAINSLFTFLVSSLLFAYLTHPQPLRYLGLRKIRYPGHFLIAGLLIMAFIPVVLQLGAWMQELPLGKDALLNRLQREGMIHAMTQMSTPAALLVNLLLFALLPAAGEELLFRGIVLRFSYHNSRNIHFAVLMSGALFSLIHADVYNFVPIFLAGVLLGYIYYFSGSIWLSIWAHFLHNGLQMILLYAGQQAAAGKQLPEETFPLPLFFAGLLLSVLLFWYLRKKATPLPAGWSNDFEDITT
jgi:uncharacterized protein